MLAIIEPCTFMLQNLLVNAYSCGVHSQNNDPHSPCYCFAQSSGLASQDVVELDWLFKFFILESWFISWQKNLWPKKMLHTLYNCVKAHFNDLS